MGRQKRDKRHKEIDRGKIRNVCEREPVRGSRMRLSSHIYMDTIVWNKKGIMAVKLHNTLVGMSLLIRGGSREKVEREAVCFCRISERSSVSFIFMRSYHSIGLLAGVCWQNNIPAHTTHATVNLFWLIAWWISNKSIKLFCVHVYSKVGILIRMILIISEKTAYVNVATDYQLSIILPCSWPSGEPAGGHSPESL